LKEIIQQSNYQVDIINYKQDKVLARGDALLQMRAKSRGSADEKIDKDVPLKVSRSNRANGYEVLIS